MSDNPARRVFSKTTVLELAEQFKIEMGLPELAKELNHIRLGYFQALPLNKPDAIKAEIKKELSQLKAQTAKLENALQKAGVDEIGPMIEVGLLHERVPSSEIVPTHNVSQIGRIDNRVLFAELISRLRQLKIGAEFFEKQSAIEKGRKPDYALQAVVRRAGQFWEYENSAGNSPSTITKDRASQRRFCS